MKIMRWCLPAQKTRFQLRILNVPLGKSHIGFWALSYALHPPMWKISFRFAREHSFPSYLKQINCFEEMLYRKIDFTFWGVTLFKRALKRITLNKMKERLVHYGDNALMFASTKKQVSTTYFECIIRKTPYRILGVKSRPSPPIWKISFRLAREHSFPLHLKKINCF